MAKIKEINAREILDSRGIPTIEAKLTLDTGFEVIASASSGESLGKLEGVELRDNDLSRYDGNGVLKAASYINTLLRPKLIGANPEKQADIDYWLIKADGTPNRSRLGVNTMSVVSQLMLKASARIHNMELYSYINSYFNTTYKKKLGLQNMPAPIFNMINGGKHGTKNLEFQEFQFIPSSAFSFDKAVEMGVSLYGTLKTVLDYRNAGISVSEEGGFTPNLLTNTDALDVMKEALIQRKINIGVDAFLGLDIAASQFSNKEKYPLKDKPNALNPDTYIEYLVALIKEFNILVVEDPIHEEDAPNWKKLFDLVGNTADIIGDDFIAGDKNRLIQSIKDKTCSGIVIKFNQVATMSEIFELINVAKDGNIKTIFSQRLGETNDDILADFAVGLQAHFVKFGAPVRGERVAKYNRLLEINEQIIKKLKN